MLKLEKISKLYYFRNFPKHRGFAPGNESLHPGNGILANQRALFAPIRKLQFVSRFFPRCAHPILLASSADIAFRLAGKMWLRGN
jgi:hypothetical protein